MSLPQSALPCSSHLIPMHRLYHTYIFCTITLLFALSKHTHTHKHKTTILHYPSSQEHYIFFCTLHTSSTRSLFTFHFSLSSWTQTLSKSLHITIGSDSYPVSINTLCGNVLTMCMYICSRYVYVYVYVYVIYVC